MLRFCLFTTFYPPYSFGGDAVYVRGLAHLLADRGHHVEVVHCRDSFDLLKTRGHHTRLPLSGHPGVKVHSLRSGWGPLSPMLTHATGRPWLKRSAILDILESGFDVLHYHNLSLIGGPGLLALGQGLKLYTSHEYWLHCPTHVLLKFGKSPCQSKSCWLCTLAQRRPIQFWRSTGLMSQGLKHIDLFLSPTQFAKDLHLSEGQPGPVELLPSFVPDHPANQDVERPRSGFLYVGRLEQLKGVLDLIEVFRQMPERSLTIVGDGTLSDQLQGVQAQLPNIRLLGYKTSDELPALYRQAKAVLVPSRSYELMPLVVLEAMAASTPVVVSPLGELPSMIAQSEAGLVASHPDQWRQAVQLLDSDAQLVARMGARGRQTYLDRHTPEAHLQIYLALINQKLARS